MWSKDSKRVLISKKPEQSVNKRKPSKWYVYDLNTGDTTFIDVGINFIWSPTQDHLIAFAKHNSLFFHFLDSNTTVQFYQLPKTHIIKSFQWTPDGKELLIHCIKNSLLLKPLGSKVSYAPYDVLINVNDKKIKKQSGHEIIESWK
jgi:hypothetical protein